MSLSVLYLLAAFTVTFLSFPLFIKLLERKGIFVGFNERTIHDREVAGLGGMPVIICSLLVMTFVLPLPILSEYRYFIAALILMMLVGLRDDLLPLSASVKLLSQLFPCLLVYYLFDVQIETLFSLWDVNIPFFISLALTCFTMIIIINSINLIDGIDGLSGSLSVVSLTAFATFFHQHGLVEFSHVLVIFIGSITAFLYFNFSPARIFIGDTGALVLGFLLAVSAILFMNINFSMAHPAFASTVGSAIAFISIPLFDTFRVIISRISRGKSPLTAGNDHMHHLLLELGFSHARISILYALVQVATILWVWYFRELTDITILSVLGLVYFAAFGTARALLKSKAQKARIE